MTEAPEVFLEQARRIAIYDMSTRDRLWAWLSLNCRVSYAEVAKINLGDVDLTEGQAKVKGRIIELWPQTLDAIDDWLEQICR